MKREGRGIYLTRFPFQTMTETTAIYYPNQFGIVPFCSTTNLYSDHSSNNGIKFPDFSSYFCAQSQECMYKIKDHNLFKIINWEVFGSRRLAWCLRSRAFNSTDCHLGATFALWPSHRDKFHAFVVTEPSKRHSLSHAMRQACLQAYTLDMLCQI